MKYVNNPKANESLYVNENVVVDGKIVTANGPSGVEKFENEIVKSLRI